MEREKVIAVNSGWFMLGSNFLTYVAALALFIYGCSMMDGPRGSNAGLYPLFGGVLLLILAIMTTSGFFVLQPNQAAVLLLFGEYKGTVRNEGFKWANPFLSKRKISLRLHNLNGDRIKVNDMSGNPIEIAAVIVWKVENTYDAMFEVEDCEHYVKTQSESALRHLASTYPYDEWEDAHKITLRGNIDEVSKALEEELKNRLAKAGVTVLEARLMHLAYAQEIAEAMLKRQQASAIIAARTKIVEGAVGMVRMALDKLKEDNIIELDEERKAAMVSNLLVILCGESHAQPVINAGTLYS